MTTASIDAGRRNYHTLDGMRGLAALFVVARHIDYAFTPIEFPNSFVAVDLFFVLSGFVIASAYDRRLASGALTPGAFIVLRYIRLWPLYFLGTLIGLGVLYAKIRHGNSDIRLPTFAVMAPLSALMLPSVVTSGIFPASAVAWTLFYEFLINILYALTFRWLKPVHLALVVIVAAVGVVLAGGSHQTLDGGWAWRDSWIGFARVGYSFPVGLLLYRYRDRLPRMRVSAWLVLGLLALILGISVPDSYADEYLDVAILVLLPLLVAVAVQVEPGARWTGPFKLLGVTSYAIYILHPPLLIGLDWLATKLGFALGWYHPWSGLAILVMLSFVAWLADALYDQPVRAWLTTRYRMVREPLIVR